MVRVSLGERLPQLHNLLSSSGLSSSGLPSHRAHHLRVPDNMALVRLSPYSPELNPAERLWDELREKDFANRVFDSLGAAIAYTARGLKRLDNTAEALRSLTGWDWILSSF